MKSRKERALKRFPRFDSDKEAERFVERADLSEYDFSGFEPARFEFAPKDGRVNMRLPTPLIDALKGRAKARGMPYQRFIREVLEKALGRR